MTNKAKWLLCAAVLCLAGCAPSAPVKQAAPSQDTDSYSQETVVSSAVSAPEQVSSAPVLDEEAQRMLDQMRGIAEKNREPYRYTFGEEQYLALKEKLTDGLDAEEDLAIAKRIVDEELMTYRELKQQVSHEEAVQDVDFLFQYLKYGYSGYGYFGGDEVFGALKEEILAKLDAVPEEELTGEAYGDIIAETLGSVIVDGHFAVDGTSLLRPYRYCYLPDDLYFGKDEQGYFLLPKGEALSADPEKTYFAGIGDGQVQKLRDIGIHEEAVNALSEGEAAFFMKPTIDDDGELAYTICISAREAADSVDLEVNFESASGDETKTVSLNRVQFEGYVSEIRQELQEENQIYRISERDGVKIIELRSFSSQDGDVTQLEQFVENAKDVRGEDYLIVDIRGNGGGNSGYARRWTMWFTRAEASNTSLYSFLLTQTTRETIAGSDYYQMYKSQLANYDHDLQSNDAPGWSMPEMEQPRQPLESTPNDTKVFVLMDGATGSASEYFVSYLQRLDNVYFVGTNTLGVDTFGNVRPIYLPNTALRIRSSYCINEWSDGKPFEGNGFQPDFWVDTNEAVEKVLKVIDRLRG